LVTNTLVICAATAEPQPVAGVATELRQLADLVHEIATSTVEGMFRVTEAGEGEETGES
jgi:hypothetical protein